MSMTDCEATEIVLENAQVIDTKDLCTFFDSYPNERTPFEFRFSLLSIKEALSRLYQLFEHLVALAMEKAMPIRESADEQLFDQTLKGLHQHRNLNEEFSDLIEENVMESFIRFNQKILKKQIIVYRWLSYLLEKYELHFDAPLQSLFRLNGREE